MSTEYLPHDPDLKSAVGAPVKRPVRPLVQRLRHEAMHTGYKPTKPWDLLMEAADEIERLTKERDDYERRWLAERRAVEATISGGRYPDGQPAW